MFINKKNLFFKKLNGRLRKNLGTKKIRNITTSLKVYDTSLNN